MVKISRDYAIYQMWKGNPSAAEVGWGEIIRFETYDCFHNQLLNGWKEIDRARENPATGPVFIKDVHPGDMLRVDILQIELGPLGVIESLPGGGCLGQEIPVPRAKTVEVKGETAYYKENLLLKIAPMVGVIGVAPKEEKISTMIPGLHGGNMDCTAIGVGSTLYLPVQVEGALLALGDLHARMGCGEVGMSGLEIEGAVTVKVSAQRQWNRHYPIVIREGRLIVIASGTTLDEACGSATRYLYNFLTEVAGIADADAVALMTIAGDCEVCQVVNPLKTMSMSFPLELLEAAGWSYA